MREGTLTHYTDDVPDSVLLATAFLSLLFFLFLLTSLNLLKLGKHPLFFLLITHDLASLEAPRDSLVSPRGFIFSYFILYPTKQSYCIFSFFFFSFLSSVPV